MNVGGTIGCRKTASESLMTKTESLPKISRKKWTIYASAPPLKQLRFRRRRKLQVPISAPPAVAKRETRRFPPQDGDRSEGEILRSKRSVMPHLLYERLPYLAKIHNWTHLPCHRQAFQDLPRTLNKKTPQMTARLFLHGNHLSLLSSVSVSLQRAIVKNLPMGVYLRKPKSLLFLRHLILFLPRHHPLKPHFHCLLLLFLLSEALRFSVSLLPLLFSQLLLAVILPLLLVTRLARDLPFLPLLSVPFQRMHPAPHRT